MFVIDATTHMWVKKIENSALYVRRSWNPLCWLRLQWLEKDWRKVTLSVLFFNDLPCSVYVRMNIAYDMPEECDASDSRDGSPLRRATRRPAYGRGAAVPFVNHGALYAVFP